MAAQTTANPATSRDSDFGPDVSIAEAGDAVNALPCNRNGSAPRAARTATRESNG